MTMRNFKFILGICLLILMTSNTEAGWNQVPTTYQQNINGVFFQPFSTTGWAAGDIGYVLRTTNSGINWQKAARMDNELYKLQFLNDEIGFAVGGDGYLCKSVNRGFTWISQNSRTDENIYNLFFVSVIHGVYVGANGAAGFTTNGGTSWAVSNTGLTTDLYGVDFVDQNTGFCCGENGVIMKTTTRGQYWTELNSGVTDNFRSIEFTDANTGYVVGEFGAIMKTTNGGVSWVSNSSGTTEDLLSIDFTSNLNLGYAVGTNGTILKTTDAGETWNLQSSPTSNTLQDVCFTHQDRGYAVGNTGTILYTDDGGGGIDENISVETPNGAEHLIVDTQYGISWVANITGDVDIYYSTDLGTSWNFIASVPASDEYYLWTVPDVNSSHCLVKVEDESDANTHDISDGPFTISDYQIDLTTPTDGEYVPGGFEYDIIWTTDLTTDIYIFFSSDGGNNWEQLAQVNASDHSYSWLVPEINSDECIIKLQSVNDGDIFSQNEDPFTIEWKPLYVVYPNGGQHWQVGELHNIIWGGLHEGNINVYYSVDAGDTWNLINSNVPVLTALSWTVPNEPSSECLIKVEDVSDPTIFDISEDFFTIADIHFLTPTTDLELSPLTNYNISWNSQEVENVTIKYSTDNGSTWNSTPIVENFDAITGIYNWFIPNIQSELVLHIYDSDYPNIDNLVYFEVTNRYVDLTYPVGGEYWNVGDDVKIEWESAHVQNAKISYSTDHTFWTTIVNSIDAEMSEYDWTVPASVLPISSGKKDIPLALQNLWIRIESVELPKIHDETATNLFVTDSRITVLTPNGGEIWYPDTDQLITWTSENVNTVDIEYSTDGGDTWLMIAENEVVNPDGSGEYIWANIPTTLTNTRNTPSDRCLVRISDNTIPNNQLNDVSDDFFSIAGVRVTQPDTYVKWLVGERYDIRWKYSNVENIDIKYSIDNGLNWISIVNDYPAENDYYTWTVPNTPSSLCLVRIVDNERSALADESGENFTITGLLITYPQGGETMLSGTIENITWESADIEFIKLEYSTDNGNSWVTIISNTPANAGAYPWLVPQVNSAQCLVRVSDPNDPDINDHNDPAFVILGEGIVVTSPEEGDIWEVGDIHQISWVSSNVDNVIIDYSFDNQESWQPIAANVDASLGVFNWVIPDNPSTECFVRVRDSENLQILDISDQFFIKGTVYPPPTNWKFKKHTGNNAIIVVPQSLNPKIIGRKVKFGDALGVFYERDGEYVCAGYGFWLFEGDELLQNLIITVWADNEATSEKDGFDVNEKYMIYAWDATEGVQYRVWTSFVNNNDYYYHDNISILSYFQVVDYQDIILPGGVWTMISTYLDIVDDNIDMVCSDIEANMYIFKDDEARVYIPEEDVNTLNTWDYDKGYVVYMRNTDTLRVWGYYKNPANFPITLQSMKWYIIPYLLRTQQPIATALNSLAGDILVLKNNDGEVYYPNYGVDQIGMMVPGEGYKIICDTTETLVYDPGNWFAGIEEKQPIDKKLTNKNNATLNSKHSTIYYQNDFEPTGNNATLLIETENLNDGDEIAARNSDGVIIGSAVVNYGKACITIWGDNRETESLIEGAFDTEEINFTYWYNGAERDYKLILSDIKNVISSEQISGIEYREDNIWTAKISNDNVLNVQNDVKSETLSINANPQPARENVYVNYSLTEGGHIEIDIFNELGSHCSHLFSGWSEKGTHRIKADLSKLNSGIFLLRITRDGVHAFNKIIVIN
jgi:photosystem II stability/assembly factor-like uncharacterized protein